MGPQPPGRRFLKIPVLGLRAWASAADALPKKARPEIPVLRHQVFGYMDV
jgi:hypothetical protein